MFKFAKQTFILAMMFFSRNLPGVISLSCISMKNQDCKVRPEIIVNSNEPVFYPFSIKTNICGGSCNNINDPYAKIWVPDVIKDLNVKVFNLMSRTNETRHIKWHETCKCKCRLDASVCNNKQRWNNDKCQCECKELMDKGILVKTDLTKCKSNSCILYIVLFSIFFTTDIGVATYFVYYRYINHNEENVSLYDYLYQWKNY